FSCYGCDQCFTDPAVPPRKRAKPERTVKSVSREPKHEKPKQERPPKLPKPKPLILPRRDLMSDADPAQEAALLFEAVSVADANFAEFAETIEVTELELERFDFLIDH